jgi:two-component system, NtrC family, nitrogen regulation response regulator NtrX
VDRLLMEQGRKLRFAKLPESQRTLLQSHRWPGNVRELRNVLERLLVFPAESPLELMESASRRGALKTPPRAMATQELSPLSQARARAQDAFERDYLVRLLEHGGESLAECAKLAGVSRQFLGRLLRKHQLR